MKSISKCSLVKLAFFQAFGIVIYCGLVGLIFWRGNPWFGKMNNYLGPVLVLTLLSVSVLVCGLLAFGYPVILFWDEKKTRGALKLVGYTAGWLLGFIFLILTILLFL